MDDAEIADLFAPLGPVSIRRMFGGKGVYFQGEIVAVVLAGELRLKADFISAPEFEAAGSTQWTYPGRRGPTRLPYWSAPLDALDDPETMGPWLRLAFEAALRARAAKAKA